MSYMWLTLDTGPASAELRGVADGAATVGLDTREGDGPRLASLWAGKSAYAFKELDYAPERHPGPSFGERFSIDQSSGLFDERFFGEAPASRAPVRSAAATPPAAASSISM